VKFYIYFFILIVSASLSSQIGFALTTQECNELLKEGDAVQVSKLRGIPYQDLIECASPSAAKTEPLSPYRIFVIITNSVASLAVALAILAFVVATIKMATSAGDKTKFQEGINLARNSGIAIALALTFYSILTIVLNQIGFEEPETAEPLNCVTNQTYSNACSRALCPYDRCRTLTATDDPEYCTNLCGRNGTGGIR
jgi:hypothetical protein